jgi:hypothetical protein
MTTTTHNRCDQCEVVMINGARCHEHGCPDAWQDFTLECKECGMQFKPEQRYQITCDYACFANYHGLDYDDDA